MSEEPRVVNQASNRVAIALAMVFIGISPAHRARAGGTLETKEVLPILNQNPRWAKAIQDQFTLNNGATAEIRFGHSVEPLAGRRAGPYRILARRKGGSGDFDVLVRLHTAITYYDSRGNTTTQVEERAVDFKEQPLRIEITGKDDPIPAFISQLELPAGWNCLYSNQSRFRIASSRFPAAVSEFLKPAHGLWEPKFAVEFENTASPFDFGGEPLNPYLRLTFYPRSEMVKIQAVEKMEAIFSWDIPVRFGQTSNYYVISSPEWMNHGMNAPETRLVYQPFEDMLRRLLAGLD